ncbi:MAG: hypothetical protein APR54_06980, partial [Candidatus Cloacimonas sp. SDB]
MPINPPTIKKNKIILAFQESATDDIRVVAVVLTPAQKFPLLRIVAPAQTAKNKDINASLKIKQSVIASIGGTKDQIP